MHWRNEPEEVTALHDAAFPADNTVDEKAILAWSDKRDEVGSYFRLNIWGMQEYRVLMEARGMLTWDVDQPDFPRYAEYGVSDEEYNRWDGEEDELGSYSPEFRKWYAAEEAWISRDTGGVMPGYKFCSNDGWVVTPEEISKSLSALGDWIEQNQQLYGPDWQDPILADKEDDGYWSQWIAYLYAAKEHGGIVVL